MSICWYCYWGWSKPVADIYKKVLDALGGDNTPLHYGPVHIVWDDENFDNAEWCLEHFDEYTDGYTKEEMDIVHQSLVELTALPYEQKEIVPCDYDGEFPANYPPECEVVKV